MSVIILKEYFKIIQIDNVTFRIEFSYPNSLFVRSLIKTKLILGATATSESKIIQFRAQSVKSFKQKHKISITEASILTENLTRQLQYLIEQDAPHTILGYNPENIIVINDTTFAFLGGEMLIPIQDNKILVSSPFCATDFYLSPELRRIWVLPSYVHYKTTYFSLACVVLYSLLTDIDLQSEKREMIHYLDNHPIQYTKLYWLLSRCLDDDPEKRSILYI